MSGTWPTSPGPSEVELHSQQPVMVSMSESGRTQSRIVAGHTWRIKLQYPKMTRAEFAPIFAFAAKQRGDEFTVTLPNYNAPQGAVTGSININGTCDAGSTTMNIEGFVAGTSAVFKAGDIFKADSSTKVYMAAADADAGANSDLLLEDGVSFLLLEDGSSHLLLESSGQASVSLVSPVIEAISDGTNITYNNTPFTVRLDDDGIQQWKTTAPTLSDFSVDLLEAMT